MVCTNIVQLSGAKEFAEIINGYYEPTSEFSGNATVYKKQGCDDIYIEYFTPTQRWIVTRSRGSGTGFAVARVPHAVALEACPSYSWQMFDSKEKTFVNQSSFSVTISGRSTFETASAVSQVLVVCDVW